MFEKFSTDLFETLNTYYYQFVDLLPKLGLAILVFIIATFLASRIRRLTETRLSSRMDDPLFARFIASISKIVMILIGILLVLKIVGFRRCCFQHTSRRRSISFYYWFRL